MIIAIDGPAGSGKSTVAKLVAGQLGFAYLDTGAMYRAVAARALAEGLDLGPEADFAPVVRIATTEPISFGYLPGEPLPTQVFINGQEVTEQIRTAACDVAVSPVSAHPGVRTALTEQQRAFGREHDTVMEGRDIGTVVFPQAELKVFLTATAEERAHRRALQNQGKAAAAAAKGQPYSGETDEAAILADILRRDTYDSSRAVAPLKAAEDAIELDTTGLGIDEVVSRIVGLAEARR
ncbi:MAG: (d)CMP kinase [Coriobacteriales bacterium]|nr:(d)CMP kinase [Coriobacteriales bacterium]